MDEDVTGTGSRQTLQGIAEIRHFFRTNETPIYFVGATPFNLLGIDRWVRNFRYVTYYDAWDGEHPHVITPRDKPYIEFSSGEEINNYLLHHPARMVAVPLGPRSRWSSSTRRPNGSATSSAMTWCCPGVARSLEDRHQLGNEAGAPSVPNVLVSVDSWETLVRVSTEAGLGTDLVVQTPYGDSGKTTFFISSEAGRSTPDRFWAKTRR